MQMRQIIQLSWFCAEEGSVEVTHIGRMANGQTFRVNNKFDEKLKPCPKSIITDEVKNQLLKKCRPETDEQFATRMRYGIACSDEVGFL